MPTDNSCGGPGAKLNFAGELRRQDHDDQRREIPRSRPETQGMFGLFKFGVGPSLSYTVGPMKAASASDKGLIVAPGRAGVVVAAPGPCKQTEATDGRGQCIKLYSINISSEIFVY